MPLNTNHDHSGGGGRYESTNQRLGHPAPALQPQAVPAGAGADAATISIVEARHWLNTSLSAEPRPVDALCERLSAADGPAWFLHALDAAGLPQAQQRSLCAGDVPLSQLKEMKESAKTQAVEADSPEASLNALLLYYLCVASALRGHDELITTMPASVWADTWVRLADVLDAPWRDLLLRAAGAAIDRD